MWQMPPLDCGNDTGLEEGQFDVSQPVLQGKDRDAGAGLVSVRAKCGEVRLQPLVQHAQALSTAGHGVWRRLELGGMYPLGWGLAGFIAASVHYRGDMYSGTCCVGDIRPLVVTRHIDPEQAVCSGVGMGVAASGRWSMLCAPTPSEGDTPPKYAVAMRNVPRSALAGAIRRSWSGDTSAEATWMPDRPSAGQCAVTALVVQDYLGGDLVRAIVGGVSHYWNRLPDGSTVDLTRDQFPSFQPVDIEIRAREYVMSFRETALRYRILADRARSHLTMESTGVGT